MGFEKSLRFVIVYKKLPFLASRLPPLPNLQTLCHRALCLDKTVYRALWQRVCKFGSGGQGKLTYWELAPEKVNKIFLQTSST